jgi:hypothetical protein
MSHPKQFSVLLCLTLFFLCGCSKDNALVEESKSATETTAESVNVVFRLQSNQTSILTRGTATAEDSNDDPTTGLPAEYKVNNARVYFFDSATKLFTKSVELTGLTPDPASGWIYEAKPILAPQGHYDIFVTANTDRVISKDTEDEFLADIDALTYTQGEITDISNGIVMTNRAVDNLNKEIKKSNKADEVTTIQIMLERVVARLDVAVKYDAFALTDDGGNQYATIKIKDFYIVNYPKQYYTYRHVAVLNSLVEPVWTMPENFGKVADVNGYVIDPYFFKKKVDATDFTNQDKYYANYYGEISNPKAINWKTLNPAEPTNPNPKFVTSYCLENCMLAPAQKNGYSTGVLFQATMEPYNNVYRLNSAEDALEKVTDPAQYAEEIYYYDYKFFNSSKAVEFYVKQTMPGATTVQYEAQKFVKTDDGYHCYYRYWIRHLDNYKDNEMGVMEFGIVRNNYYRMLVTSVKDLGFGGKGTIEPNPDIPDEGEASLKVVLNVKPWVVRKINVEL